MSYLLQNLNNVETIDSAGNLNVKGILTSSGGIAIPVNELISGAGSGGGGNGTTAIDINNGYLYVGGVGGGYNSVNWVNNVLIGNGFGNSVDWQNQILWSSIGSEYLNWNLGLLLNGSANTTLDWIHSWLKNNLNETTLDWQNRILSGAWTIPTGGLTILGSAVVVASQTGNFISNGMTGVLTNQFYPLNSNPAGYVTSAAAGSVLQITGSQALVTGNFTGISGIVTLLSGTTVFINGNPLQNQINTIVASGTTLVLTSQTGNFISNGMTGVLTNQFVSQNQTGNFIYNGQTSYVSIAGIELSGFNTTLGSFGPGIYTFEKTISTGITANIFIASGNNGTQIFDVMVSSAPTGFGICKRYNVVNSIAIAQPVYSLAISSGPVNGNDFTTTFSSTGNSGIATLMSITNNSTAFTGIFATTLIIGAVPTGALGIAGTQTVFAQ
jgi:hypothetical protein